MIVMHVSKCPKCGHTTRSEVMEYKTPCPECQTEMKHERTEYERLPAVRLSDMGICQRCGKFASSGKWIRGAWYGPECKDKV